MKYVFFARNSAAKYPMPDEDYSPHTAYPEYPFSHLAKQENVVYDMVRQGFLALGMDKAHRGTPEWNPLGELIQQGQNVLIKPNWVKHENGEPKLHNMDCMVTHPSVIRAVVDYVVIALKGTGKITIADAPIQSCDFEKLMKNMHYNNLWAFYNRQNVSLVVRDLRGRIIDGSGADKTYHATKNTETGVLVNLENQSAFAEFDAKHCEKFRVTNYDPDILLTHHTAQKHEYLISSETLEADVIINLPKPKAHRKAGMTACCKNLIGICSRKEYLPHHSIGAQNEGGDEYLHKNFLRRTDGYCIDQYNRLACKQKNKSLLYWWIHRVLSKAVRCTDADLYSEGSWYGNDTIWRTIVDLNRIVQFADCNGKIHETPQRQIFHICDMIITGEGEGPLMPSPKALGGIVMGDDNAAVDRFICSLIGFEPDAIRYIVPMLKMKGVTVSDIAITDVAENTVCLTEYPFSNETHIQPTAGWTGHIEANIKQKEIQ